MKTKMVELGLKPELVLEFLKTNVDAAKHYNETLKGHIDAQSYYRNKLMIAQIELLIMYLR